MQDANDDWCLDLHASGSTPEQAQSMHAQHTAVLCALQQRGSHLHCSCVQMKQTTRDLSGGLWERQRLSLHWLLSWGTHTGPH